VNPEQVIAEQRPMLDDVLGRIGLHSSGHPLDLRALASPFEAWLGQQVINPEDLAFVASLIGAFLSQYLIAYGSAEQQVLGNKIVLRLPFQAGIVREFEPYAVAFGIAREQRGLTEFLENVCTWHFPASGLTPPSRGRLAAGRKTPLTSNVRALEVASVQHGL
jgi:hypothetical protein